MPTHGVDDGPSLTALVNGARAGDDEAWRMLWNRIKNVAWKTINAFALGRDDADDAFAATFFRLAEKLDTIRDPEYLPGWVATTARREVLVLLRTRRRFDPFGEVPVPPTVSLLDEELLNRERRAALYAALGMISERCQRLLRLLTSDPPLSYAEIGELTGLPHGSIGPTRQRCIDELRRQPPLRPFMDEASS